MLEQLKMKDLTVGIIGFGEVGKTFGEALIKAGVSKVAAYDRLLSDAVQVKAMRAHAVLIGVEIAESLNALLPDTKLVISAVTASEVLNVARGSARHIVRGTYFVDVNSASPKAKIECAALIDGAGGRYVESAVMASVPPYGIRVPMLLGGTHAAALAPTLQSLGFDAKPASEKLGVASAIKMCRSVIIKGMEALAIESFTTARGYGVEAEVLASLNETFPDMNWDEQGSYFFERVVRHGKRRAEEMREAATTVRDGGLDGCMAAATAERQAWIAGLATQGVFNRKADSWRDHADAILAHL
jgi:3-hydroxyisobutyrate dehydrogenase-like beta-hydroxyacid dehydrogenase